MREIKFRAWDEDRNKMQYVGQFDFLYNRDNEIHAGNQNSRGEWQELKLMQFTGLKDKNGKEIYEGDIVETKGSYPQVTTVIWKDGGFTYKDTRYDWDGMLYPEEWVVIGNIYENEELVNDSSN